MVENEKKGKTITDVRDLKNTINLQDMRIGKLEKTVAALVRDLYALREAVK